MTLWTLLRHRLTAYWRVSFLGRRLASLLFGTFLTLYLGGGLALAGVFFDNLVRDIAPSADPLLVAAKGLLPFGLGYAALRSIMESGLGVDPRPYQALPVPPSTLIGLLAIFALFSLWNAVPLAFVGTICVEMILNGAGGAALRFGLASFGVLAAVTYVAPMLRRAASGRPVLAIATIGVFLGMIGIEAIDLSVGLVSLVDVSGWLFGGMVRGIVAPASMFGVGLACIVWGYAWWLKGAMVVDRGRHAVASSPTGDGLDGLARRGPAWREAVLEIRLLWRNSQPRLLLFTIPLLPVGVTVLAFFPLELADLQSMSGHQLLNMTLFPGLFATGAVAIYYGTNLFSWEGHCLEATMARPAAFRSRVAGKLLFLEVGTLACFLLPLPVLLFQKNPFLIVHTSFYLYNAGVVAPAMIAGATFNRNALTIDERSFSQTNFSGGRTAIALPLFGAPFLFLFSFDHLALQFGGIAVIGCLSLLAMPLWLRGLTTLYDWNRYAMLEGFQASRDEQ